MKFFFCSKLPILASLKAYIFLPDSPYIYPYIYNLPTWDLLLILFIYIYIYIYIYVEPVFCVKVKLYSLIIPLMCLYISTAFSFSAWNFDVYRIFKYFSWFMDMFCKNTYTYTYCQVHFVHGFNYHWMEIVMYLRCIEYFKSYISFF